MGTIRGEDAFVRLLEALEAQKIHYILIGMSGAIAQGVMATTIDVDLWINLAPRQYMRVLKIAQNIGAIVAANTVVYLEDGTPVNFVYEVTGLGSFLREARNTAKVQIHGHSVPVLPLERIVKSKEAVGRDKDKLHIIHIQDFLRCKREMRRQPRPRAHRKKQR